MPPPLAPSITDKPRHLPRFAGEDEEDNPYKI